MNARFRMLGCACLVCGFVPIGDSAAQAQSCDVLPLGLYLPPRDAGLDFGSAVAAGDGFCVVGGPDADELGPGTGVAYVYRTRSESAAPVSMLLPSVARRYEHFGDVVDASADRIIVGTRLNLNHSQLPTGAFVFRNVDGSWMEEAHLLPGDVQADDRFGSHVAIDGGIAAVAAPGEDSSDRCGARLSIQRSGLGADRTTPRV